jgi:sigma-B regulation protein RsbU (phosphoserine phosphatase)
MGVNEAAAATGAETAVIRDKLIARRARLEAAGAGLPDVERLSRLLREVDGTLDRIANGTFGLCDVCHDPIEADRLAADPLVRTCLDHLTKAEQRALEQDLDLAGRIQHGLLPKRDVSFEGWDTHYHYEPLGPASGDYCDLITSGPGELTFLLGDVSGKGVAASVLMAHLHAIFRSLVSLRLPCRALMERANRIFCESTNGDHYATLVCGSATSSGEIEICNAGHCPPVWIRERGTTTLPATGVPLGLFCGSPYSTTRVMMGRGETLLLYTDGVTEARDSGDLEYGTDRLVRAITRTAPASAADLVAQCRTELTAFRGGRPRTDDVTILAVRRSG